MARKKNAGYEYIKEITSYFDDIQNIRKLSREEEKELCIKIQRDNDNDALNKLVYHNLKFVVNIAKNYRDTNVPFADIISEGNLGLIHAAKKFDYTKDVKFISYAVWWVRNSINECIEEYNREHELIECESYTFNNQKEMDYHYEKINEDFENKINTIQSRKETIHELMKCLHEREVKILTLFYGLDDGKEKTLDEVGKFMNLTNERVRQIKDRAISKMKCQVLTYNDNEFNIMKTLS